MEQELRNIEEDAKYNLGLFDRAAIKDLKMKNLQPLPKGIAEISAAGTISKKTVLDLKGPVSKLKLDKVR